MNYSNYRITLDVRKTVASVQLTAKKGDAGRKIYITLSDKGSPCQIADGCYAVFAGRKPDGTLLYNKTTIEDNTIIYAMTQQTTAVAGLVACEVKLFDSMSNLLTSPKLTILVDDVVVSDEEIASKDEVTALAELISEATATRELANQAIEECNTATEAANTAAQTASTAAGNADTATGVANAAAGNATAKANAAEEAATAANNAGVLANQATATANNAASSANAAAEETIAAKEDFLTKAEEALAVVHDTATEDAPAIVCEASGEVISVEDASDRLLKGLSIFGRTVQNGTPTPSAPIPLESISGNITVSVTGNEGDAAQTLTVTAEGGLHGFDAAKDEIDLARGVRVERIKVIDAKSLHWQQSARNFYFAELQLGGNNVMCNSYPCIGVYSDAEVPSSDMTITLYKNLSGIRIKDTQHANTASFVASLDGVKIAYPLATPIETPLTANELTQFAALHTNKPNTTVFNDAGAEIKLTYVADTKAYIDNKFIELAAAMLNN